MSGRRYRLDDRGAAVIEIRAILSALGLLAVDDASGTGPDEFDPATELAVRHFQQQRGLSSTGIVDGETYRALDEARWRLGDRLLTFAPANPLAGDDVVELQRFLHQLGFDPGAPDGVYGPHTEHAIRALQADAGLPVDGICGFRTLEAVAGLGPSGRPIPSVVSRREADLPATRPNRVVLDPGHGGADRGYCSRGLCEADVAFDLATRIEGRLVATGARAYLTRGPQGELDEVERAAFANHADADLVISIHVDRHVNPDASGISSYYFGTADEPEDEHFAGGEQSNTSFVDHGSRIGHRLAGLIQREIVARTGLRNCRTHPKTWDLLRRTRMPAVRVEVGYLSNADDAARLSDASFRDVVAEAIVVAIQRLYLSPEEDYPTGVLHIGPIV